MTGPAFLRKPARIHAPVEPRVIRCRPFAQLAGTEPWRMQLLHDRTDDLLLWITRGQGRIVINGVRRGLGVNNAIFLPAGTLMAVEMGAQSLGQVIQSPPGASPLLPREPLHLRPRDTFAQAELTSEIEAMQREIARDRPMTQDALAAHLTLVSVWLERQTSESPVDAPRETAGDRLVRRFAAALVEHFRSDMVMADYAEMLDVTPTHLTRVCRAACGKSAADMLTERVVYEARVLLCDPDPAIQDIASALGFSSAAYFARFMQHHTGETPTALRARAATGGRPAPALVGRRA
ncbi:AraC family transcriptional regulator [Roseivivax marinus]|jgi:AraC family transcriptional activator of pobA|uniref:AraC family transcriptional regulator n=1 Tax=Roseivivax marinus TaxID=1379903 RepID=W4HLL1_9RHOB|nr:AraC family transcriptional regulator [Roseivivax marinus]ETW13308.1 AraC family transcriptional regulator [Roseivivax marinus]UMA66548.1 AraC family transcriptional regulator [Roseivivax marinus]SEK73137.1 transcriptional regulator, AraC family [Roseivivax marinus]